MAGFGLINVGAGLSAMGQSISDTARLGEINAMDDQKLELANQLRLGTETALAGTQYGYQSKLASAQQASAQQIASGQEASAQTIAAGHEQSEQSIADKQIKANSANIMAQIGAEKTSMQFDGNGNPFILNELNGRQTPLLDKSGQPIRVINTALVPVAMATVNSNNEQMRAENQQFGTQLNSLNQQLSGLYRDPMLAMNKANRDAAAAPILKQIDQLNQSHATVMQSLRSSSAQATASLFVKGASPAAARGGQAPQQRNNQGGNATPKSGNRPPLGSFLHPAPQPGAAQGQ